MKASEVNKLIFPLDSSENNEKKYYAHNDETYDIYEVS
jgi:hypothetical protein